LFVLQIVKLQVEENEIVLSSGGEDDEVIVFVLIKLCFAAYTFACYITDSTGIRTEDA